MCSVIVLATFWATHEWERRATLREYRWASGVGADQPAGEAAEQFAERAADQPDDAKGEPAAGQTGERPILP